jgi:hypothetical protein
MVKGLQVNGNSFWLMPDGFAKSQFINRFTYIIGRLETVTLRCAKMHSTKRYPWAEPSPEGFGLH